MVYNELTACEQRYGPNSCSSLSRIGVVRAAPRLPVPAASPGFLASEGVAASEGLRGQHSSQYLHLGGYTASLRGWQGRRLRLRLSVRKSVTGEVRRTVRTEQQR
jgi:hypothetical protein